MLPSLPGYGFSGEPTELGWDVGRIAQAWAELMHRLGYTRYVAQGGDVGAAVTDAMGRQAPEGLLGIHMNLLVTALAAAPMPADTEEERAALDALATFRASGFGYFLEQATRPQTIGYALLDSPVALAAWMLDHDTDSYYKISRAFVDGQPAGNLTRDHILDNITLYWLTGTGASAARSYWENGRAQAAARPARLLRRSRSRSASPRSPARSSGPRAAGSRTSYPNLTYFNEVDRGGHFAAWEEPELFADRDPGGVQVAALIGACGRRARKVRAARGLFAERLALSRPPLLAGGRQRTVHPRDRPLAESRGPVCPRRTRVRRRDRTAARCRVALVHGSWTDRRAARPRRYP